MIALLFIGFISVLLGYLSRYPRMKYCYEIAFMIITIFMSIRYMWGNDMPTYMEMFRYINSFSGNNIFDINSIDYWSGKDYGWVILNILCAPIGFFGMQIILAIFQNFVIYKFIKNNVSKKWYWFAIFIYVFNSNFLILSSSMMRQSLAMTIFVIASSFIVKRKIVPYILLTLLATSFHQSAIVLFPIYFTTYIDIKISYKTLFIVILFYILWFIFSFNILGDLIISIISEIDLFDTYEFYLGKDSSITTLGLGYLFIIVIAFIILGHMSIFSKKNRIYALFSTFFILFLPFVSIPLITRVSLYFQIFTIVMYPNLGRLYMGNKYLGIALLGAYMFLTLFNVVGFFNSNIWCDAYMNYHTIFDAPCWM